MLSGGDSPAGLIGPQLYRDVALPHQRRVISALKAELSLPVSLHICGNAMPILADMVSSGADVLELDHRVDIVSACRVVGRKVAIWGNLDPVGLLVQGTPGDARRATQDLIRAVHGHSQLVVSSGCTLAPETPTENLAALIETAASFNRPTAGWKRPSPKVILTNPPPRSLAMTSAADPARRNFLRTAGATGLAVPYLVSSSALAQPGKPGERAAKHRLDRLWRHGPGELERLREPARCRGDGCMRRLAAAPRKRHRPVQVGQAVLRSPRTSGRKDLDGVIIGTPPHWHCLMAVDACRAGKDLYLQKPMTLHLAESLAVRNAVRKYQRICQVGTQIHASENYRRVVEWIRSGKLGKISVVRTFNVMNQGPQGLGNVPDGPPPAGLDWDRWVGPCPMRPFNSLIVQDAYTNCSFMDYSGGWTPGMAPHIIDLPVWALELGLPTVTCSSGGRYRSATREIRPTPRKSPGNTRASP